MSVAFIILFCIASQLIHSIASDQQNGYNPYPFGSTFFCLITHPILLVSCVWYLGWIVGIIAFLCHFFGILHMAFSWILDFPIFFMNKPSQIVQYMRLKIGLLPIVSFALLVFTIASFFTTTFKTLYYTLLGHTTYIIIVIITVAVCSVLRIVVLKSLLGKSRERK